MALIDAVVELPFGHRRIDFDKKKVRTAIVAEAREVRKIARRLVSRRAISSPGEYPGRESGSLMRSIKVFAKNKKWMGAVVRPHKTAEMDVFHPGILYKGSKKRLGRAAEGEGRGRTNRRARGDRVSALAARAASDGFIIRARKNYMEDAMSVRRVAAREAIYKAVQESLIPR